MLIQLVTVLVLWWTFQRTVIPIQQKELLAEQAARLERENKRAAVSVAKAQATLSAVNEDLDAQRRELAHLKRERLRLEQESRESQNAAVLARRAEERANAMERAARAAADRANVSLESAQWNIFASTAMWVIYEFDSRMARINIENAGADANLSYEDRVRESLKKASESWLDYEVVVNETASEIRQLRSPYFTPMMAAEFASVFESEGRSFRCQRPDFAAMEARYLADLASARATSHEKALAEMREVTAKYASEGRRAVFESGWEKRTAEIYFISDAAVISLGLGEELRNITKECEDRFVEIGSAFLRSKTETGGE
ncbi:hypothetical protein [Marilutibacter maris]|uniref:hypothetical protein n=1 Tax=Marilutibacter maris TaxID=1605891 RepID=UPI0011AE3980|nr:hypothetical protein [Lysobacter maris]